MDKGATRLFFVLGGFVEFDDPESTDELQGRTAHQRPSEGGYPCATPRQVHRDGQDAAPDPMNEIVLSDNDEQP